MRRAGVARRASAAMPVLDDDSDSDESCDEVDGITGSLVTPDPPMVVVIRKSCLKDDVFTKASRKSARRAKCRKLRWGKPEQRAIPLVGHTK